MSAMHEYSATVVWQREAQAPFVDGRYSRAHEWHFDGGVRVAASSSPLHVPLPMSAAQAVDPEEAFVAALSSCHMLFFLFHAGQLGLVVERYEDAAIGWMGRNAQGRTAIVKVALRPRVQWAGVVPDARQIAALHERSHHDCYLANSVTAEVVTEPQ
jgi:organic hydroperoxide reductase OsmC/OhrA